jgi:hypothetical protein
MALDGEVSLTVSQAIIDEMADVLARKFDASPDDVAEAKAILAGAARTVTLRFDSPSSRKIRPITRYSNVRSAAGPISSLAGTKTCCAWAITTA